VLEKTGNYHFVGVESVYNNFLQCYNYFDKKKGELIMAKGKPNVFKRIKNVFEDVKANPDALMTALLSALFMGAGQVRNKQWYKAIPLFVVLVLFLGFEFVSGSYQYYAAEIVKYPAGADGAFYFFRDYGGFIAKGIWGLFSLGAVTMGQNYRGQRIVINDNIFPWKSADNSIVLLGFGLIALVIVVLFLAAYVYNIRDAYNSRKKFLETGKTESFKEYVSRVWERFFVWIIISPAILLVLFFTAIPFLFSFSIAFTNYNYKIALGVGLVNWSGIESFQYAFQDAGWLSIFVQVFLWTAFYAFMSSVTVYFLGFFNAMVVESKYVKGKRFWRTSMIIPWAIPAMISLMVFRNAFDPDGLINQVLIATGQMKNVSTFLFNIGLQGQIDTPIFWFDAIYNGRLAKFVIILVNLWLGAPYFMMLIAGVLNTISGELYEAADIDGANGWDKWRNITLPLVIRATIPVIVTTFTFNFNNFGAIFFLTGGGPAWDPDLIPTSMRITGGTPGQTDILISWIYNLSFNGDKAHYNLAAVYSMVIFFLLGGFAIYNLAKARSFWEED
jgi:arabinogalactan oligomer/maltooligosaccharide transport system permease protein